MDTCQRCGISMGLADASMLSHWIATTGACDDSWADRVDGHAVPVCPSCDSYALGVEMSMGLPFHSQEIAAFLTVNDWDFWNLDPQDCDIQQWPDFGCLTFSEASLRSAIAYRRETQPAAPSDAAPLPPVTPDLLGPTGIPGDENAHAEWGNQLNILHARMGGEFSLRELDNAVRDLIRIFVPHAIRDLGTRATAAEITNFFWHCLVAARLMYEFEDTTVTRSHFANAVRKATVCWIGRNGVRYASQPALARKNALGEHWERCGLVKEHAVPVAIAQAEVRKELKARFSSENPAESPAELPHEVQGLTPEVVQLFQQNPRAWAVAQVIREWTLLAWITKEEDEKFDEKDRHGGISIRKRMPKDWNRNQSRFARYDACDITVSEI